MELKGAQMKKNAQAKIAALALFVLEMENLSFGLANNLLL